MKQIRLIKQKDVQKQEAIAKAAENEPVVSRNPVEVVREWAEERKASKPTQARKMFAALFAQPQPE